MIYPPETEPVRSPTATGERGRTLKSHLDEQENFLPPIPEVPQPRPNIIPYTLVRRIGRCGQILLDKVLIKNYDSQPNPNDILRKRKRLEELEEIQARDTNKLYEEFTAYIDYYQNQRY